jgi:hypothetical protein
MPISGLLLRSSIGRVFVYLSPIEPLRLYIERSVGRRICSREKWLGPSRDGSLGRIRERTGSEIWEGVLAWARHAEGRDLSLDICNFHRDIGLSLRRDHRVLRREEVVFRARARQRFRILLVARE